MASGSDYQRGTTAAPETARKVLAVVPGQTRTPGNPLARAAVTTAGPANSNITFTARTLGTGGNSTTITYVVAGNNTPLSVTVNGQAITVNVATNGTGQATSTGAQVAAAIQGTAAASALVDAQLAAGNDGTGVVAAIASTPLAGGVSMNVGGTSNAPLPTIPPIHYSYGQR